MADENEAEFSRVRRAVFGTGIAVTLCLLLTFSVTTYLIVWYAGKFLPHSVVCR